MRLKAICMMMLLALTLPALALVEGDQVAYLSGTTTVVKPGWIGTLEVTSPDDLAFRSSSGDLRIRYATMDHIGYRVEVARHLGVLPAIAAGLVRKRESKHYLEVVYHDEQGTVQVARFELAKGVPAALLPVLQARAPKAFSVRAPNTVRMEPGNH